MDLRDAAWLAGILDGEGCLYARFTNLRKSRVGGSLEVRVTVQATSQRMIDAIESLYRSADVHCSRNVPRMQPMSTRPAHKIDVFRKGSVERLLRIVLPHMKVKDREASAILAFFDLFPSNTIDFRSSDGDRLVLIDTLKNLKKIA